MMGESSIGDAASSVNPLIPAVRPTACKRLVGTFKMLPRREQDDIETRKRAVAIKQMDFIIQDGK